MSYGPRPWQQAHWDWRAAGNFICGGAGSGLIVGAALAGAPGLPLLAGLALVGLGLFCVWLEIGRPLRAINVFRNPRTSWMTREAIAAVLVFAMGGAALLTPRDVSGWVWAWAAGAGALAFLYCQARMLRAARGIPAWREPRIVPLLVVTGLAEGGGLLFVLLPLRAAGDPLWIAGLALLLVLRMLAWIAYRRRLAIGLREHPQLAHAGQVLAVAGTLLPLLALTNLAAGFAGDTLAMALAATAGAAAAGAGSFVKFTLITRVALNQGFALAQLPVRGVRP
ncbi:MAG: phenylacetyl-CoA:acceptor oxidoreductase [Betaproteobacteria bacterium]